MERIGFIGLGIMGAPMAGHLAKAGYALTVLDIDADKTQAVTAAHAGVRAGRSPKDVAENSDIVVTMLPFGEYVRDVALGPSGLVEGFSGGELLIDTSSSEPWLTLETAKALAEKGVAMIDAPTSGAQIGAKSAQLVFMVGGDEAAVARAAPVLGVLGRRSFHLGPIGSGHTMKSINNLITAMNFLAAAESLALGVKLGLDPNAMTDVLNASTGMSWITQTHIKQRITTGAFDDPFKLELMVKDIRIALELAANAELPMPLSALGQRLWREADRCAGEHASVSELVRWVERQTGVEIRAGEPPTAR